MRKIRLSLSVLVVALFSLVLVSCSGSPESVLEKAAEKNKEVTYAKQNVDATIEMAGMKMSVNVSGEMDNKNKKSIMKMKMDASAMGAGNQETEMYVDDKTIYIKDPTSDKYMKTTVETSADNSGFAASSIDSLKEDSKVKETVKMEKGDNSDKIITAEVSSETVKKILNNVMKSQMSSMDESMGDITAQLESLEIENMKYTGKVNKEGFLYGEELSFDMKESQSGLTLKMVLKTTSTNINEDKTVTLPEIPKDKIVEGEL